MFLYGPTFLVEPARSGMSTREAIFGEDYTIKFGSMNGEVMTWELASPTKIELKYDRNLLVGFDARECLVDKIDKFRSREQTFDILEYIIITYDECQPFLPLLLPQVSFYHCMPLLHPGVIHLSSKSFVSYQKTIPMLNLHLRRTRQLS